MNRPTVVNLEADFEAFEQFNLGYIIRRALPSFGIVLLIALGILTNWGLAIAFFFKEIVEWQPYITGLIVFAVGFPVLYLCFTIYYGRLVIIWESYQQFLRALIGNLWLQVLEQLLPSDPEKAPLEPDLDDMFDRHNNRPLHATPTIEEQDIIDKFEQYKNKFSDKIPGFLQGFTQIFFAVGDLVTILKGLLQSGQGKETIKGKAFVYLMENTDANAARYKPSYRFALILAMINLGVAFWLF